MLCMAYRSSIQTIQRMVLYLAYLTAFNVAWSIKIPGPIVLETEIFLRY